MSEKRASYSTNITRVTCLRCATQFEPEDGYQSWSLCYDCGQSLYTLVAAGNEATKETQKTRNNATYKKATVSAKKTRERAIALALEIYERDTAPARETCRKAIASAREDHMREMASAWEAYKMDSEEETYKKEIAAIEAERGDTA